MKIFPSGGCTKNVEKSPGIVPKRFLHVLRLVKIAEATLLCKFLLLLVLFEVGLEELLLNISRNRLEISEIHSECRTSGSKGAE